MTFTVPEGSVSILEYSRRQRLNVQKVDSSCAFRGIPLLFIGRAAVLAVLYSTRGKGGHAPKKLRRNASTHRSILARSFTGWGGGGANTLSEVRS